MIVSKTSLISGPRAEKSEKFYLKNVSKEEIAKIEYEDTIQNFARMFENTNIFNFYDYDKNKIHDSSILFTIKK